MTDDELVRSISRIICCKNVDGKTCYTPDNCCADLCIVEARAALAAARPVIRNEVLEEAAGVAKAEAQSCAWHIENMVKRHPHDPSHPDERRREFLNAQMSTAIRITSAIRALKEKG